MSRKNMISDYISEVYADDIRRAMRAEKARLRVKLGSVVVLVVVGVVATCLAVCGKFEVAFHDHFSQEIGRDARPYVPQAFVHAKDNVGE